MRTILSVESLSAVRLQFAVLLLRRRPSSELLQEDDEVQPRFL